MTRSSGGSGIAVADHWSEVPAAPPVPLAKRLWRAIPVPARRRVLAACNWTGLPFLANYLTSYRRQHAPALFAGGLVELFARYEVADAGERDRLLRRFDAIVDAIVLPSGVRKTTYAARATSLLRQVLDDPACAPPGRPLRVLDLPASTGAASRDAYELIAERWPIASFDLADLAFHLLYDRARGCVFDADRQLLQVRTADGFADTTIPHIAGSDVNAFSRLVLAPLVERGERLRRRFRAEDATRLETIPLLRPDILADCRAGRFATRELDVFAPLPGPYDLILSFNLLQSNYFPPDRIEAGRSNLGAALAPGGVLVMGSPDAGGLDTHAVYRREADGLRLVRSAGTL